LFRRSATDAAFQDYK
jgi:hypothetical protein